MHETTFCQKTEAFSSNFQFTCRANLVHLGRFLHFSQKVVGVTLRMASDIMTYVKSDQVKQSVDNRLLTEDKVKLLIRKEFDQCGSFLPKIMLEGEMYDLLTKLPLTVEEKTTS